MTQITQNLNDVLQKITNSAHRAKRCEGGISLVAVSKTHPVEAIKEALAAGQRIFGENRVQEAREKFSSLKAQYPDLKLHLIGSLQTNKVAEAVALFDVIQTLDRPNLALALAKEMKKQNRFPELYIEVNTGREPQKAGLEPQGVSSFLSFCQKELGLSVSGLMCIPPFDQEPTPHFLLLKGLVQKLGLPYLSMGMSADYEKAIDCGATHVRVGTAIFGSRP
jgi:PLP dependent protein